MMTFYPVVIFNTEEDGEYFAVVPDLPGCTAHGETPEEALREGQIAQELWLEGARERGWTIPEASRLPRYRSGRFGAKSDEAGRF